MKTKNQQADEAMMPVKIYIVTLLLLSAFFFLSGLYYKNQNKPHVCNQGLLVVVSDAYGDKFLKCNVCKKQAKLKWKLNSPLALS